MPDEVARIGALSRVERPETHSKVPRCFLGQTVSTATDHPNETTIPNADPAEREEQGPPAKPGFGLLG